MIFTAILVLAVCLSCHICNAEQLDEEYGDMYEMSGAGELDDALDDDTKEYLDKYEIDLSSPDTLWDLNGFDLIRDLIINGSKNKNSCISALTSVIAVSMVYAITCNSGSSPDNVFGSFDTVSCTVSALILLIPLSGLAADTAEAVRSVGVFMKSFIPVYAAAYFAAGGAVSSGVFSAMTFGLTQIVSVFAEGVIVPLSSAMLISGVGSAFGAVNQRLHGFLKKAVITFMSFATAVYLTVLELQTAITSPADSLKIKMIKTAAGSFVPVVGGALSETISVISSGGSLLKNSIGVYAIVCLAIILVPVTAKLILWKLTASVSSMILELCGAERSAKIIGSAGSTVTVLICTAVFLGAVYILSVMLTLSVGKNI